METVRPDIAKLQRGDYVQYHFDNGLGGTIIVGVITEAGPKVFRVRWESGLTNRLHRVEPKVDPLRSRDLLDPHVLERLHG